MDLRLISTDVDRVRIAHARSVISDRRGQEVTAHVGASMPGIYEHYGRSYALFESIAPEGLAQPIAGFSVHSLDAFAQSYSEPVLTGLPPSSVFEIGELWFVTRRNIRRLLKGIFILSGLARLEGLLVYPTIAPQNWTVEFTEFSRVTDPIRSGKKQDVWVQGMLLHADDLRSTVKRAMCQGFDVQPGLNRISFVDT
jgi:hypothetical protein